MLYNLLLFSLARNTILQCGVPLIKLIGGLYTMEPKDYTVKRLDGDYAILIRTDISSNDEILVARALLPSEIDEGTNLHWENLEYTII